MTDLRQAAQAVLNAWNDREGMFEFSLVIEDLDKALEQPEQEPVGEVLNERGEIDYISYVPPVGTRLYTAPPTAQPEPVACIIDGDLYFHHEIDWEDLAYQGHGVELLYTTPPAAQRKPLPFDAVQFKCRKHLWIHASSFEDAYMSGFRDAEAAHGIKEQP